jgi:hypothetical protein
MADSSPAGGAGFETGHQWPKADQALSTPVWPHFASASAVLPVAAVTSLALNSFKHSQTRRGRCRAPTSAPRGCNATALQVSNVVVL